MNLELILDAVPAFFLLMFVESGVTAWRALHG